jgi:hypothetical protein
MSALTATNIITGLRGEHPCSYAQVKQTGVIVNGHDTNRIYSILAGTAYTLGLTAPTAAPVNVASAGDLLGDHRYRIRFKDSVTGTISTASPELTVASDSDTNTIDKTGCGSPDARVTHWILERTTDGGKTFFPVNVSTSAPHGTVIATNTFADNVSDRLIRQNTVLRNAGAIPGPYKHCFSHLNRMWLVGCSLHSATVSVTNGSATVTSSDGGFNSGLIGKYMVIVTDVGNVPYKISAVGGANTLTLSAVYAGTTNASRTANFFGPRNKVAWSDANAPEHFGKVEVEGPGNEITIGSRGTILTGGCSLGTDAGVLLSCPSGLYRFTYTLDPNPLVGDGEIAPIPTLRGAVGKNAMRFIDGIVYGIDSLGIWAMPAGGTPEEIGGSIAFDFKNNSLDFCNGGRSWIGTDPKFGWVYFYVIKDIDTDDYPREPFIWSTVRRKWVNTKNRKIGCPCGMEVYDKLGQLRHGFYTHTSGTAPACLWVDNIGKSSGADVSSTPLVGTAASGGAQTVTVSGAAYTTTGEQLKGVLVHKISSVNGAEETRVIASNTATELTISAAWTTNPVAGDTIIIGPVFSKYRTGPITCGFPDRKKQFYYVRVPVKYKTACTPLNLKVYLEGSPTATDTDRAGTIIEDGVTITASTAQITADPTTGHFVYEFPLNRIHNFAISLEFYSSKSGAPWEINGPIKIGYDVDPSEDARKMDT